MQSREEVCKEVREYSEKINALLNESGINYIAILAKGVESEEPNPNSDTTILKGVETQCILRGNKKLLNKSLREVANTSIGKMLLANFLVSPMNKDFQKKWVDQIVSNMVLAIMAKCALDKNISPDAMISICNITDKIGKNILEQFSTEFEKAIDKMEGLLDGSTTAG